jgi:type IV fimbrial biogenesis protein FimT
VIAGIMLTVAVPSFSTFIKNNRMTTQINDFVTTANLSRMEAIKRSKKVEVCKSSDTNTCVTSGTWGQGWIAFIDDDGDEVHDSSEEIISSHSALSSGSVLTGYDDIADKFYFNTNGTSSLTAYSEMVLCDDRNDNSVSKAIRINPVGRVETINASDADASHQCS